MRRRTRRSAKPGGLEPNDSRRKDAPDVTQRYLLKKKRGRLEMREGEHYNV